MVLKFVLFSPFVSSVLVSVSCAKFFCVLHFYFIYLFLDIFVFFKKDFMKKEMTHQLFVSGVSSGLNFANSAVPRYTLVRVSDLFVQTLR